MDLYMIFFKLQESYQMLLASLIYVQHHPTSYMSSDVAWGPNCYAHMQKWCAHANSSLNQEQSQHILNSAFAYGDWCVEDVVVSEQKQVVLKFESACDPCCNPAPERRWLICVWLCRCFTEGFYDLLVQVGADRVTANGDTANKIGTYALAVAAQFHKIPFFVAAPATSIDISMATGAEIPIEQRSSQEITHSFGNQVGWG